jgi:transposase-like protein
VPRQRKQHPAALKAKAALAALRGEQTVNQLAAQFGVHPTLVHDWKKRLLAGAEGLFADGSAAKANSPAQAEKDKAELFEQIGRLKMELEWLKKKVAPFP